MIAARLVNLRLLALLLLAFTLATAAYGYAAGNTVSSKAAGDGQAAISGYTVNNVAYALDSADPGKINSVAFDVSGGAKPSTVRASLVTGGTVYTCSETTGAVTGTRFTCTTTGGTVTSANNLRVVSVE